MEPATHPEIVSFLFTDVEGSTGLWARDPEGMGPALALHDAILRDAVASNRGSVVKMSGDGIHAAFSDPLDALNAALFVQNALADPAATSGIVLRVRCGLHVGAVERRDGDFFGDVVNRAARIMSAAHGGQTLLSQATVSLLANRAPNGVEFQDLGLVRLRDLAFPERLYQVTHPGLRKDFPALRALVAVPHNLPLQVTSFVGREAELLEVSALLRETRLLTLVGMGGLGKTRLSLRVAEDAMADYPDGVWFVELAPLQDERLVPHAVASALGLQEQPGRPLLETLLKHLGDRRSLLILDNCEHVAQACADLVRRLLQAGPQVKLMASSRQSLRVAGEVTFSLQPLVQFESVRLFTDRARRAQPAFQVSERNALAVASICRRLDGIPLALELAAARVRAIPVETIDARLSDRFGLLVGGDRAAPPKQQTLRALMDWSHDLLAEAERILLRRLAVFAGGWTLEAAEQVCAEDEQGRSGVLETLSHLVEKSLAMLDAASGRYRLLETVREYAGERIHESGDEAPTRDRHCAFFISFAERTSSLFRAAAEPPKLAALVGTEIDNLRAAFEWSLAGPPGDERALTLCAELSTFWNFAGLNREGREWTRRALSRPGYQRTKALALALKAAANVESRLGDIEAAEAQLVAALALGRELGDDVTQARVLNDLGLIEAEQRDFDLATAHLKEALAITREYSHRKLQGAVLNNLAYCATLQADYPPAQAFRAEAFELLGGAGRSARRIACIERAGLAGPMPGRPGGCARAA